MWSFARFGVQPKTVDRLTQLDITSTVRFSSGVNMTSYCGNIFYFAYLVTLYVAVLYFFLLSLLHVLTNKNMD